MEQIPLEANLRNEVGKGYCRRLRTKGLIPGILYGGVGKSIPIEIKAANLVHILHEAGENAIINLVFPDATQEVVILREKQVHPYKNFLLHADFCKISLKEKIIVSVPIELVGTAKGVKEGGSLEQMMWHIEISALPTQIPETIKVNLTDLEINSTLNVKDLEVAEGVEIKDDPEAVVLSIVPPKEVVEEEVIPAPAEAAEPEVIREKRKEKEEEEE